MTTTIWSTQVEPHRSPTEHALPSYLQADHLGPWGIYLQQVSAVLWVFYHAVKDAHMAHVIKVDLKADLFSYSIDEEKKRYLELLDGKLLLVTNTDAPAAEVVRRYKSLADIERGFKVLKSDIEIGPVYHRLPQRIRSHALVCFMALILYRVMRMRLSAAKRSESPATLLEQLKRIHQQTVQTADGKTLTGLTEMTPAQKSLFAALELALPTPENLTKPFCSLRFGTCFQ